LFNRRREAMSIIKIRDIVCSPGEKVSGFIEVGERPGSKITIPLIIANGQQTGPIICLIGGTHSTEYCGIFSIIQLMQELKVTEMSGAVIAVPVINLPGFEVYEEVNPIDGLQILEACPGDPDGTITQIIVYTLFQEIISLANYVIDFHGGGRSCEHLTTTIYKMSGDNKIDAISEEMSLHFLLDYCSVRDIRKNATGIVDKALLMGKPGFLVEAGGEGIIQQEVVDLNLRGIKNVLRYLNILKGEVQVPKKPKIIRSVRYWKCNRGGIFTSKKKVGELMQKGDVIGEIIDIFGKQVEIIKAPFDGMVYGIFNLPPVSTGDAIFMLASFEGELFYKLGGYSGYRQSVYKL
jgi:uncharacterized protein